jgi:predicted transcriptional regulator
MGRPTSNTPTDWELFLLQTIWEIEPSSVEQIQSTLRKKGIIRSESSLRTILRIMTEKELIKGEVINKATHYTALVKRPAVERTYFHHLVENLFKGNQEKFLLRVLDETEITDEVVQKMQEKIEQYKNYDQAW